MEEISILSTIIDWVLNLVSTLGVFGVFLAMAIEAASVPIPSELIMGLAGFLVYKEDLSFIPVVFAGALGNTIGSLATYAYGYYGGRPVIKRFGKYLDFNESKFERVEKWFNKYGNRIILFAQLLPFVRSVISLPAGILKVNIIKFEIYTFFGALAWCAFLVGVSASLGQQWEALLGYLDQFGHIVLIIIGLALITYFIYLIYRLRVNRIRARESA